MPTRWWFREMNNDAIGDSISIRILLQSSWSALLLMVAAGSITVVGLCYVVFLRLVEALII